MIDAVQSIRRAAEKTAPLIHCITNPISITRCADAILAVGARPMMAEHPEEAAEITATAGALVVNLGSITDGRIAAMEISAKTAMERHIPLMIDAVGIACSALRRQVLSHLLLCSPALIKGNYSEIYAFCHPHYTSRGVDAEPLETGAVAKAAVALAQKFGCIITASGETDIVTDGKRLFFLSNGTKQLAAITGTGCMLGCLCGCFLAVRRDMYAAITACSLLGISGELAETPSGNGRFAAALFDRLSTLSASDMAKYIKWEEINIASI